MWRKVNKSFQPIDQSCYVISIIMVFLHSIPKIDNNKSICTLLVGLGYHLRMGSGPYFQLISQADELNYRTLYCFKKSYTVKIFVVLQPWVSDWVLRYWINALQYNSNVRKIVVKCVRPAGQKVNCQIAGSVSLVGRPESHVVFCQLGQFTNFLSGSVKAVSTNSFFIY